MFQGIVHYETFLLTGILLNLTPGNDTIFILTRSIGQGKKAGILSVLGIGTGNLIHTLLAAFGLSLVIAQSLLLFNAIKYAGAAYLLYIGYQMLKGPSALVSEDKERNRDVAYLNIYRDGVITNVMNPKVALFFMAFLPQFIDPNLQHTALPLLTLGITFTITGTLWCLTLAWFASLLFNQLRTKPKLSVYIQRFCGVSLIGLGIKVALTKFK